MNRLFLLVLVFLSQTIVLAQELPQHDVQVVVESAYVRARPTTEALPTASVFIHSNYVAVGRNMDGTWLEIRRPGREDSMGWIARDLVMLTFDLGQLPITDATTGLVGPEPVMDTGFALLTIDVVPLRIRPDRAAPAQTEIPTFMTLPIIERTPNNQWLKVNFRGTVGWIPQFLTSTRVNLNEVPVSLEFAGDARYTVFATITPAQQIAQIDRLLDFIAPIQQTAADVAFYWQQMTAGETLECRPPAGQYAYFSITPQDVSELPELRQQDRLLHQAIDDLNLAVEMMQACGVYTPQQVRQAYARALNARGIFQRITGRMEALKSRILDDPQRVNRPTVSD
jgi:hypothetical protein